VGGHGARPDQHRDRSGQRSHHLLHRNLPAKGGATVLPVCYRVRDAVCERREDLRTV